MKNINLENWLKRLQELKNNFENSQGERRINNLHFLLGYLNSINFILK